MKKKQVSVLLIVFAFISITSISMALYVMGEANRDDSNDTSLLESLNVRDFQGIDGTPRFQGKRPNDLESIQSLRLANMPLSLGDTWNVTTSDDYTGEYFNQTFELVLEGEYCNIWIGLNDSVWDGEFTDSYEENGPGFADDNWTFAYPWSSRGLLANRLRAPDPDGDGYYLPPGYVDWVTGADLEHIREEFDENIHDTVTDLFGEYADRPGPTGDGKIQVLIFNIRDGLFWDPYQAPWFTMGYFWSYVSDLFDANIFHMDSYQWWRRCGNPAEIYYGLTQLPLQYEGTFAHEFEHLVHYDEDADELFWVDEGCADLAVLRCGYGFPSDHVSEYLINWWQTSLVIWGDTLADYGASFLWTYYMWEHYGGDPLIKALIQEEANGIEGWNSVLSDFGIELTFDEIFQDWVLANYLDDTSIGTGEYGYYTLDIPSDDTEGWSIPYVLANWEHFNPTLDTEIQHYPNGIFEYTDANSLPYVAKYYKFSKDGLPHELTINFDGFEYSGVPAHEGEFKWHSGGEAWAWFRLGRSLTIPTTGATLNFWSWFQIEEDWDYGYVEVHDLTNGSWCTLEGSMSVTDVGFNTDTVNENCDDGFNPGDYYDNGTWFGFTGSSGDWYLETMDLTPFKGHDIELFFTYWTDPYSLEAGWFIDEISIPEISFYDDVENVIPGWYSNAGWERSDKVFLNDFKIQFIGCTNTYVMPPVSPSTPETSVYDLFSMNIDPDTEEGVISTHLFDFYNIERYLVMVVANQPGIEHTFTTPYSFSAEVSEDFSWALPWKFLNPQGN